MTRAHAAEQLLKHGPLLFSEFREITGWPADVCSKTLDHLRRRGVVLYPQLSRYGIWESA